MEAVLVGALLNTAMPTVLKVLDERSRLHVQTKLDLLFLCQQLPNIASAIEKHPSSERADELRELAHDIELRIGLFAYKKAWKRIVRRPRNWNRIDLFRYPGRRNPIGSLLWFASKLKDLRTRWEGYSEKPKDADPAPPVAIEPGEPVFRHMDDTVGLEAPLHHLLGLLQLQPHGNPEEQNHKVISVVGPRGVGKTLLAFRAYSSVISEDHQFRFSPHACVRAAGRANEDVLWDILVKIGGSRHDRNTVNKQVIIRLVHSYLRGKRYLIVIDNVRKVGQWWEDIKSAFPDMPQVSSRVIITTDIQSVAKECSSPNGYMYKVKGLNDDDSASLFIREAALQESQDVVRHGSAGLRRKCDGLPLALVSIANLVRVKGGLDSCGRICNDLGSHLEMSEKESLLSRMHWVLEAKYTGLEEPALKACLLYFCTFSVDHPIRRNTLIRRWLAEGLTAQRPLLNCSLLIQEYMSLWTLIDGNIIRPTEVSNNGMVKRCKPSGMVLEYITCKSMEENRVLFPNQIQTDRPRFTRWLPLHQGTGDFSKYYPRTLVVSGEAGGDVLKFSNCQLMQVLDLEQCSDLEDCHLERICSLFLLKYLSLGADITVLPRTISRLELLQTLDLRKTAIEAVPVQVIRLPELAHLLGKFQLREGDHPQQERETKKLEDFLKKKSNLETLAGFIVGRNRGFPQLMHHMRRLRKVKIICNTDADPANLIDLREAIGRFICDGTGMPNPSDRSMSIDFHDCSAGFLSTPWFQAFAGSLPNACGSLGSLKLRGPGALLSRILPITINLGGLQELCLSTTTTLIWNDIVIVDQCRVLRFMKLEAAQIEGPAVVIGRDQFISLKRLSFVVNQMLPQISIEDGADPDNRALKLLESLHLICEPLDGLSGIQITHLTGLKEVVLHPRLHPAIVNDWKAAASRHPNRPSVSN